MIRYRTQSLEIGIGESLAPVCVLFVAVLHWVSFSASLGLIFSSLN